MYNRFLPPRRDSGQRPCVQAPHRIYIASVYLDRPDAGGRDRFSSPDPVITRRPSNRPKSPRDRIECSPRQSAVVEAHTPPRRFIARVHRTIPRHVAPGYKPSEPAYGRKNSEPFAIKLKTKKYSRRKFQRDTENRPKTVKRRVKLRRRR